MEYETYKGERLPKREVEALKKIEDQIGFTPDFITKAQQILKINLDNTRITDLSPLTDLTLLQTIHLRHTGVSDITPLGELQHLRRLHLGATSVSEISPVKNLRELRFIGLRYTYVSDISVLSDLPNLEVIDLVGTSINKSNETVHLLERKGVTVIM